jgi:hypothetical protein
MKPAALVSMTASQLIERFAAMALAQDDALRIGDTAELNRLFWQMDVVEQELKRREGDMRRALLPFLEDPNAQIRLKSGIATLALAPEAARRTLQLINDRQEYPQAPFARSMMQALDEGTYVPT